MNALLNTIRQIRQSLRLGGNADARWSAKRSGLPPPRFIDCMELEDRMMMSGTPLGVETLVNTTTADLQQTFAESPQAVASDANGNYVAVWSSLNQDGSSYGVYAQRFNASGVAQGSEFQVNTATANSQQYANVAMSATGGFVVTWSTDATGNSGIRAVVYDANGVAQTGELQVNTYTTDPQNYSDIAMDAAGNFVITWSSFGQDGSGYGIYAQRFTAAGAYAGTEFRVNSTTAGDQIYSSVGMDAAGNFVVVWESDGQDGSGRGIYGQRYDSAGVAQGGEFLVNTTTAGDQTRASVGMRANGEFGVTWTSADASGTGIYSRAFNAAGVQVNAEFRVNTTTAGNQNYSSLVISPNGEAIVTWASYGQDVAGTWGIYAQKFTDSGTAEDGEFRVNTTTAGDQLYSSAALNDAGNAVIVWSGAGSGDTGGVFQQRYLFSYKPTVTTSGSLAYTENAGAVALASGIVVSDTDSTNLISATVTISGNYVNGQDVLAFTNQNGITGVWNAGTGTLTLTGSSSVANYQTALRSITYTNNSENPSTAVRTVSFVVNDGVSGSVAATRNINVTAVNDASVLAAIEGAALAYTENDPAAAITSAITISDVDSTTINSATIQITGNYQNGADLLSFTNTGSITGSWNSATGTLTLSGVDTLANYQAALRNVRYSNTSDSPSTSARTVTFQVNDGTNSNTQTRNINVSAANDVPVNTVPGSQSTNEDATLVFSSGNGNQISIADIDAGGSLVQVSLNASNGKVTLASTAGLTFSNGDGVDDPSMTFAGTVADINNALNGMSFTRAANYNGAASLQIVTNDQGNTGSGGPLSDSDTVNITVGAMNDAPVNTVPGPQNTNEDTALVFSNGNGNQISIGDLDAGASPVQVTLTATNGTITLAGTSGLAFSTGDGTSDGTMTFTGTMADINTALNGMSFGPTASFSGAASLQIVTNDQGNTGSGGPLSDSDTVNITVAAVNDAPVNMVPGPQNTNEDTALVFSNGNGNQISIGDVDAGASPVQVTLTATNGTITLAGTSGLAFSTGDGTSDGTMTFTGTVVDINTALNGMSFGPTASFSGAASLQIVTNDQGNTGAGGPLSASDTVNITVAAVNDAPVNTVPGPQNTNEDTALVFSSGNGNQISIGDVDAGASPVQVTLTATNGTITLAGTSGLAFSTGDGTSDGTMTFTGTVVDINAALDGLSFTTPVGVTGSATLTVVTDDQGSTGGPAMSDTDVVNIAVSGLNDVPTIGVPGPQSSDSQTLVFSAARGTAITLDDLDANGAVLELTLTATNGAITLGNTSGITFMQGDGTDDPTMRIRGTVADLNQALDGLQFRASDTAAQLSVSLNDLGNTGAGGPAVASRQIDISQTPLSPPSSPPADSGSGSGSGSDSSDSGNDSDKNETPAAAIVPLLPPRPRSADSSSLLQPLVVRDSGSKDAAKLVMSIDVSPSRTAHVSGDELGNPDSHVVMLADGNLEKPVGLLGSASYLDAIEEQKLWDEIRALNDSIESAMVSPWTYGAVAGMGVLSAGYLLWAFQAGSLVTTALSSLPVWGSFDPLPVLEFWERDKHKNRDDHDEEDRYLHSEPETRLTS